MKCLVQLRVQSLDHREKIAVVVVVFKMHTDRSPVSGRPSSYASIILSKKEYQENFLNHAASCTYLTLCKDEHPSIEFPSYCNQNMDSTNWLK